MLCRDAMVFGVFWIVFVQALHNPFECGNLEERASSQMVGTGRLGQFILVKTSAQQLLFQPPFSHPSGYTPSANDMKNECDPGHVSRIEGVFFKKGNPISAKGIPFRPPLWVPFMTSRIEAPRGRPPPGLRTSKLTPFRPRDPKRLRERFGAQNGKWGGCQVSSDAFDLGKRPPPFVGMGQSH